MRAVPKPAVEFVAKHEGLRLKAYQDVAGVWTIGYGHTGPEVREGQMINQATARKLLKNDLAIAAGRIQKRIGAVVHDLTENQYAALLSFTFNLGDGKNPPGHRNEWTIWKRLRARQFDQIPVEMAKFVNAGGKKVQGLVTRRAAEQVLWSTDEPGSEDVQFTSASLRQTATPPTPADPVPAKKSLAVWAAFTAGVGGFLKWLTDLLLQIPEFAHSALSAINPFTDKSPLAAAMANGLGALAAAAGIYVAWATIQKKREHRS